MGIKKVTWNDIKDSIFKVVPSFAEKVDQLKPDESFPLYVVSFPYGV